MPKAVRKGGTCIEVVARRATAPGSPCIAPDRVGLLADVAALFAMQRAPVRAARAWSQGDVAVSVWDVADEHLDPAVLRQRFDAIASGRVDPPTGCVVASARAWPRPSPYAPRRRPADRDRGTGGRPHRRLYLACAALAAQDVSVRSAHVDTLGPQAVDVFYVQESGAGAALRPPRLRGRPRPPRRPHPHQLSCASGYRASRASGTRRVASAACDWVHEAQLEGARGATRRCTRRNSTWAGRLIRTARGRPSGPWTRRTGSSSSSGLGVTGPLCSSCFRSRWARAWPGSKTSMKLPKASPTRAEALAATRSIEGPLHADDGDRRQQHHADRGATHHQERASHPHSDVCNGPTQGAMT